MLRRVLRRFSFENRWDPNFKQIAEAESETKKRALTDLYPVEMPYKYRYSKDRAFDFDLPEEFSALDSPLQIWAVDDGKFSVNNVWFQGPILIFRDFVFEWNVERAEDIQDHHLELARQVFPKLDYIIIGTGKFGKPVLSRSIINRFNMAGVAIEYCSTFEACGTFNLASEDMRNVCAGMIPHNIE